MILKKAYTWDTKSLISFEYTVERIFVLLYVNKLYCRPRAPLHWLDPGAFGTLGVGGGFALGAKLCRPDCDVWIIYGDGSLGYSIAEFDTFTRHKVRLFICLFDGV